MSDIIRKCEFCKQVKPVIFEPIRNKYSKPGDGMYKCQECKDRIDEDMRRNFQILTGEAPITEEKKKENLIKAQAPEMLELLKKLEFPYYHNDEWEWRCFICENTKGKGHADDCKLGKLLREIER